MKTCELAQESIKQDDSHFFCPVYDGLVDQYDCDEISCGVKLGWIPNDGVSPPHGNEGYTKKSTSL